MGEQVFVKVFLFCSSVLSVSIPFVRVKHKITGQHHVNGHLQIKKKFISLSKFSAYFLRFSSACLLYLEMIKSVLYCFGKFSKIYYLFGNDPQEIWCTKVCHNIVSSTSLIPLISGFLQKCLSFFSLSFHNSTICL